MRATQHLWLWLIIGLLLGLAVFNEEPVVAQAESVPHLICQESPDWQRPADAVQQEYLDGLQRLRGADWLALKDRLSGIHIEINQRAPGSFRDFINLSGLWQAEALERPPQCAVTIAGKVEIWLVLKRLVGVEQESPGNVTFVVEPQESGFQVVHLEMDDLAAPGEHFTMRFHAPDGSTLKGPMGWTRPDPQAAAAERAAPAPTAVNPSAPAPGAAPLLRAPLFWGLLAALLALGLLAFGIAWLVAQRVRWR